MQDKLVAPFFFFFDIGNLFINNRRSIIRGITKAVAVHQMRERYSTEPNPRVEYLCKNERITAIEVDE